MLSSKLIYTFKYTYKYNVLDIFKTEVGYTFYQSMQN